MSARLLRDIIADEEEIRHDSYEEAITLPAEKALPILRKGLRHWDRSLRNKCARSIIKFTGSKAVSLILPLYAEGQLFASSSLDLLLRCEDETLIKYLLRKKGTKDSVARAARTLYEFTKHGIKKRVEKQAAIDKKLAEARAKREKEVEEPEQSQQETKSTQVETVQSCLHEVPFLEELESEGHGQFLYYQWTNNNSLDDLYDTHSIPKKSGGERQIEDPHPILKAAQRLFLQKLTETAILHDTCHGFRPGKSIISNATPHVGKDVVINLDLKDFFPTVTSKRVYGILKAFGYEDQELRFLTDMTTYDGRLPQGAPTSPMLANIVCMKLDRRLNGLAQKIGADYTRYADDLSFSGPENIINFIPVIRKIIAEEGFQLSLPKLRIHRKGARQDVTGLTVNEQVSIPRAIRRRLRAAVHRVELGKDPFWKGQEMEMQSLKGHLSYLASVHPEQAEEMLQAISQSFR